MSSMSGYQGYRGPTGLAAGSSSTGAGNIVPKGYSLGRLQNFTPEQQQLFQSLFSQVSPDSFTSKLAGGDESTFNQLEAPALKQFSGLQGNLASRFSGMGMGARRSSGFQNSSSAAASDFAQQLQSNRVGLQQQAIKDLMSMSGDLLSQRPYEQTLTKKSIPFWKQLLLGAAENGSDLANTAAKGAIMGGF